MEMERGRARGKDTLKQWKWCITKATQWSYCSLDECYADQLWDIPSHYYCYYYYYPLDYPSLKLQSVIIVLI